MSKYPFYFIIPQLDESNDTNKRCISYELVLIIFIYINYSNQKWDDINLRNPKKSVLVHNVTNSGLGSMNNTNQNPVNDEYYDPNKIKINFNLY